MNVIEIRILNLIIGNTNIYCSRFKSDSVDFPTINLLIEGVSTEAQYIMSHWGGVLGRRCLKGSKIVYLRGSKSVYLKASKIVLGKMSSGKGSPQANLHGQVRECV